jgi:hypothetical protein
MAAPGKKKAKVIDGFAALGIGAQQVAVTDAAKAVTRALAGQQTPEQKAAAKKKKLAERAARLERKKSNTVVAVIDAHRAWFVDLGLRSLALLTIDAAGMIKLGVEGDVAAEIKPLCKAKSKRAHVVCCKLCADPSKGKIADLTEEHKAMLKTGDDSAGKLAVHLNGTNSDRPAIATDKLLTHVRAARAVLLGYGVQKMIAPSNPEGVWDHLRTKHANEEGVKEALENSLVVAAAPDAAAAASEVCYEEQWLTFKPLTADLELFVTGLITQYFCRTTMPISHCEDPAFRALLYQIA